MSLPVFFWVSGARRDKPSGAYRDERLTDLLVAVSLGGLVAAGPCFVLLLGFWIGLRYPKARGRSRLGAGTCEVTIRVIWGVIPVFVDRY